MISLEFVCLDPEIRERWEAFILQNYSQPNRAYHNISHIQRLFQLFEQHQTQFTSKNSTDVIRLAILFHDVIYDPTKKDNERKSNEEFEKFSEEVQLDLEIKNKVSEMIIATEKHENKKVWNEQKDLDFFLDFDLEVLSWDLPEYKMYAQNIRKEYQHIPDEDFKKGRASVLQKFLQRETIYFSEIFQKEKEEKARENLKYEIHQLEH